MATCFFASVMIIANGLVLSSIYKVLIELGPEFLGDARLEQGLMFVGPVVMLIVEWWIFDLLIDLSEQKKEKST